MTALPKFHIQPPSPSSIPAKAVRNEQLTAAASPDTNTTVASFLIGLLIVMNVMLRFPDLGATIEHFNQF